MFIIHPLSRCPLLPSLVLEAEKKVAFITNQDLKNEREIEHIELSFITIIGIRSLEKREFHR